MKGLAIFTPSHNWAEMKRFITSTLKADPKLLLRVRAGVPIPLGQEISQMSFGIFHEGAGRALQGTSQSTVSRLQFKLMREVLSTAMVDRVGIGARDIILGEHDCLSVAPLAPGVLNRLKLALDSFDGAAFTVEFDASNELHLAFFWRCLVDSAIVDHGKAFVPYEDGVDQYVAKGGRVYFVVPHGYPRDPAYEGMFSAESGDPIFEEGLSGARVPARLEPGRVSKEGRALASRRAPATRVADSLGAARTLRISGLDDPAAIAIAATPPPGARFPNLLQVENKIREYCLSSKYDKVHGFRRHGYGVVGSGDSVRLAGLFCSALMDDFPVIDSRANADGTVQYTVPMAIIGRYGTVMFLETSWYHSEWRSPQLSTAYVVSSKYYSSWASPQWLKHVPSVDASGELMAQVDLAVSYSHGFVSDAGFGAMYLRPVVPEFAEWGLLFHGARYGVSWLSELVISLDDREVSVVGDLSQVEAFSANLQSAFARKGILVELSKNG